jgi:predicted O-methyltransferase YrrM
MKFLKRLILKELERRRSAHSASIPYVELHAAHLEGLQVLTDRTALLRQIAPGGIGAELGVLRGDFSAEMLQHCAPARLHLVDTWPGPEGAENLALLRKRFAKALSRGQVLLHQGDSTAQLQQFPAAYFDWVYIDTDHSYPTTAAELRAAARALKPGGLLMGHDYVTGNWNSGVRYGVVEAVHAFCVQEGWGLRYLTAETHRHLSFALRRLP